MLSRAGGEAHVSNTSLARILFRGSNGLGVRVNPVNPPGEGRDAERQAGVAAPEVEDAPTPAEQGAAPRPELVERTGSESCGSRGDVPAKVADRVRFDTAHF